MTKRNMQRYREGSLRKYCTATEGAVEHEHGLTLGLAWKSDDVGHVMSLAFWERERERLGGPLTNVER